MRLDRPVLITGTPRSGKTLLWRILARSPEFIAVDEPLRVWDTPAPGADDDRRSAADANDELRDLIRGRIAGIVAAGSGSRYLDNLSHHALRLGFVHAILPEARVVHMIRDPREAVCEMLFGWTQQGDLLGTIGRRWGQVSLRSLPGRTIEFVKNYLASRASGRRATWGPRLRELRDLEDPADLAAAQWVAMVEIALTDLGGLPELAVLNLRYEELVADPTATVGRLCRFCEVRDPGPCLEYAAAHVERDYEHFEPCRVEPSAEQWRRILARVRSLEQRLDYNR